MNDLMHSLPLGDALPLTRSLICRNYTVTTTRQRLIRTTHDWPYLISNPQRARGLAEAVNTSGVTTVQVARAFPYSTQNYEHAHLFFTVTAITGTWDLSLQSYDTATAQYFTTQVLSAGMTTTANSQYFLLGPRSLSGFIAFLLNPTAAGTLSYTFSLLFTNGNGVGLTGTSDIVYLGGPNVTTSTGFPLLPDTSRAFAIKGNVDLWAISSLSAGLTTSVFTL